MARIKAVYKDGFLDGMRACGHLVVDVTDESIELKPEWKEAIEESYIARNYGSQEAKRKRMIEEFMYETCSEIIELRDRVLELEGILEEVSPERKYGISY